MVPALGGAERKLAKTALAGPGRCGGLSWSRDGKFLAFVDRSGPQAPYSIFLLAIETGQKRRFTTPLNESFADFEPRFSPDGRNLAFLRCHNLGCNLYLQPSNKGGISAGEAKQITYEGRVHLGFDWTADGRRMVYSAGQLGISNLWMIPSSGGTSERLAVAGVNAGYTSVSRVGNRLAYERDVVDFNIWRIPGPTSPDRKSAPVKFIASTQFDIEPQFSPDGAKIAFSSSRSGSFEIWVCDREGHNPVQLTSFDGQYVGSPRWSPDSRWIAFDGFNAGNSDVYVISADGGGPRRLTRGPSNNVRPSWSRDGRWIYFGSNRSGIYFGPNRSEPSQIWKVPAAGGEAVQVTKGGGEEAFESADGKFVYWVRPDAPGVWRVQVEGGHETQLHDVPMESLWALTGEGICFFDMGNSAGPVLKFFSFSGRATLFRQFPKETRVDRSSTALSVSPDGRWILYTQIDQSGSDVMLVENFW
jgi:Tol biopolymer transport system component